MRCQLSRQNYQRVLVLAFFLRKFNVLSGDILMTSPLCWHSAVSKTVITVIPSQGGCYLHCANEEIEIQGYLVQKLVIGGVRFLLCFKFTYVWPHGTLYAQCCTSLRYGGINSSMAANIVFDFFIRNLMSHWTVSLANQWAPGSVRDPVSKSKVERERERVCVCALACACHIHWNCWEQLL